MGVDANCNVKATATELIDRAADRLTARLTTKLGSAWSSYEVWRITMHEPRSTALIRRPPSLAQQLDAEEDRLLIRKRKHYAWRVLAVLLLLVASSLALFADRHHGVAHTTQEASEAAQSPRVSMPVAT